MWAYLARRLAVMVPVFLGATLLIYGMVFLLPGDPIAVGNSPAGVAVTPDGATVYVINSGDDTVTPIGLASD